MTERSRIFVSSVSITLVLCGAAMAHNPDGTLTAAEEAHLAQEQYTIYQMQLAIVHALQQSPVWWELIDIAFDVIDEANGEIEQILNHQ